MNAYSIGFVWFLAVVAESRHTTGTVKRLWWLRAEIRPQRVNPLVSLKNTFVNLCHERVNFKVRDCLARDESLANTIQLTDDRGCILKPKLFGAFQKTKDTGNTGASIIAYAYFQAFKFPDVMDLYIECNVELCKTDCEPCPQLNQQIEPGRRRRSIRYTPSNTTSNASAVLLSDPIRVARGFKVIMVDDLSQASNQVLEQLEETAITETTAEEISRSTMNVCMTYSGFYITISFFFTTILATTITAVTFYVKLQRVHGTKANCS